MERRTAETVLIAILLAVAVVLAFGLLRPFLRPMAFAVVIGIGFQPLYVQIRKWVRRPGLSSLLATLAVLVIFVLPAILLATAASGDLTRAAQYIGSRSAAEGGFESYLGHLEDRFLGWAGRYVNVREIGLEDTLDSLPSRLSSFLLVAGKALVGGLAGFAGEAVLTFLILFFVFRDGVSFANHAASLLPISRARVQRLFEGIRLSVVSNLYGILAVALVQGLLTGVGMAIAGVGSALLLGTAAAFLSMVPLVGTALVWVPASIYLLATGHIWKAVFLIIWCSAVVGMADNIIRPLIVGEKVKLHPLLLLFALIGGVQEFGFIGIFVGPVVVSVLLALVEMLHEDIQAQDVVAVP
jgi:predicted PurR-regulated permease PerM